MPSCIHVFIRGPKKGIVCRNESPQDKCYKHRDLTEYLCEGSDDNGPCDLMTTNISKRCNKHQFRGAKLLKFKETNDIPLTNVDKIQKIIELLKLDDELLNSTYNSLTTTVSETI